MLNSKRVRVRVVVETEVCVPAEVVDQVIREMDGTVLDELVKKHLSAELHTSDVSKVEFSPNGKWVEEVEYIGHE